jgi:hypothetical protein
MNRWPARIFVLASSVAAPLATACAASTPPGVVAEPSPIAAVDPGPVAPPVSEPAPVASAAPSAAPPPASAPSPVVDEKGCVRNVVEHAAGVALQKHGAEIEKEFLGRRPVLEDFTRSSCVFVRTDDDLDGDGVPDRDVSLCLPPGGHVWSHHLYFSNKGCPKLADHIVAAELSPLAPSRGGAVKDLESRMAIGCAGNDFTWMRWRWTGTEYKVVDRATCSLCTDFGPMKTGPGVNQHPYCKKEMARRKANP